MLFSLPQGGACGSFYYYLSIKGLKLVGRLDVWTQRVENPYFSTVFRRPKYVQALDATWTFGRNQNGTQSATSPLASVLPHGYNSPFATCSAIVKFMQ